jgi:tRNA(adenine34) deaminase
MFMKEAIKQAQKASRGGDVPVGAVIVRSGRIIARGENQVQRRRDPTLHAEIVAIRRACKKLGEKFLPDCEIHVSLEPCAMCAAAISFARIKHVFFAAEDKKGGGILHNARVYETDKHLYRPAVSQDEALAPESAKLLKEFFKSKRGKEKPTGGKLTEQNKPSANHLCSARPAQNPIC